MTKKQIEQELFNHTVNKTQVKNINIQIENIKREYQGIKGMSFDSEGGGGTNAITRSIENEVIKKDDKIEKLLNKRKNIQARIDQVDNALSTLDDIQRRIIEERYFKHKDWNYVADIVGYTYQWVNKINNKSLETINKLISL